MIEIWKTIKDFEKYQVSNLGRVRNTFFAPKVLKPRKNNMGYYRVLLSNGEKKCERSVHRLVLEAFKPKVKNKNICHHIDGHRTNNCIDNLKWVNTKEHSKYRFIKPKKNRNIQHIFNNDFLEIKRKVGVAVTLDPEIVNWLKTNSSKKGKSLSMFLNSVIEDYKKEDQTQNQKINLEDEWRCISEKRQAKDTR